MLLMKKLAICYNVDMKKTCSMNGIINIVVYSDFPFEKTENFRVE